MRIAIVLNTSWNIYNFRMGLIKELLSEGHEIHAIAPHDLFSTKIIESGCEFHAIKMDSRGANPIKDSALIMELFFIYRRIKPDVILHFTIKPNIYGSIAASMLKIPVVNNVCGLGTVFLNKGLVSRVAELLYKFSFRTPKKVYFQNPHDKELFISKNLVDTGIVDILPGSGIDTEHFTPSKFKRNKKFTFLMISRMIYDKGVQEYVDAIKIMKAKGITARFKFLGAIDEQHKRGIKAEQVNEWVDSGIIEYLGSTEDVRPFIKDADCIVLPSYREGTPRTLLEAASSAKPIVATNVPGCNNVVEHGHNGLLCELKDPLDLAEKMIEMLSMSELELAKFGQNGRKKVVEIFSENKVISSYINTVNKLNPAAVY